MRVSKYYGGAMKKVLFIHNSIPEYRVVFWRYLGKYVSLKLVITNPDVEKKIYGFDKNIDGLDIECLTSTSKGAWKQLVSDSEVVILPPIDSLHEYIIAKTIRKMCIDEDKQFIYWTEKWVPSNNQQPLKKKIKNWVQTLMIKSVVKGANECIASGSQSKAYLEKKVGVNPAIIHVAYDSSTSPHTINREDIRRKYAIPKEQKIILFLGRLISRKGCDVLIKACLPLLKQGKYCLLIAGTGDAEESLKAQSHGIENIRFVGKIQPIQRRDYFEQSDAFVLPSVIEGGVIEAWGLTVNEALECGTPVIATDAVGAAYDLLNERNGIMIKQADAKALREGIVKVLDKLPNREEIKKEYSKYSVRQMALEFAQSILSR